MSDTLREDSRLIDMAIQSMTRKYGPTYAAGFAEATSIATETFADWLRSDEVAALLGQTMDLHAVYGDDSGWWCTCNQSGGPPAEGGLQHLVATMAAVLASSLEASSG